MKKTFLCLLLADLMLSLVAACESDDSDFSSYTLVSSSEDDDDDDDVSNVTDTIVITYDGQSATVTGDADGHVTLSGADVVVDDTVSQHGLVLVLSGSTSDGSLLVWRSKKYTIVLNGVSITNADGPAINNQCSKSLFIVCGEGTENTLADGTAYAEQTYDQKGTLFSEGQIYFSGSGTLNVTANSKNAIASDDFIAIGDTLASAANDFTINTTSSASASNGVKANDGVFVYGGTLTVSVAADGARGIRSDARVDITGGTIDITTTGDCLIEQVDGVADTTSCACIKSDSLFTMSGGTLTMLSTGDGGKGIRCDEDIRFSGGTLVATTTGSNDISKPKALKSDTGIIVSGGSFKAEVSKSWACDNGTESEDPADHLTVVGTPSKAEIAKKSVVIVY
ncbi:MAG: carbohydrate-binding domain-containing protein [Prevotella sp.]|nr:carbohydrate-binding domain-containing protein [Prevotella sp.]